MYGAAKRWATQGGMHVGRLDGASGLCAAYATLWMPLCCKMLLALQVCHSRACGSHARLWGKALQLVHIWPHPHRCITCVAVSRCQTFGSMHFLHSIALIAYWSGIAMQAQHDWCDMCGAVPPVQADAAKGAGRQGPLLCFRRYPHHQGLFSVLVSDLPYCPEQQLILAIFLSSRWAVRINTSI